MNRKPVIAISMGDPSGVGAEVTLKALAREEVSDSICAIICGDETVLRQTANRLEIPWRFQTLETERCNPADLIGSHWIMQPKSSSHNFLSGNLTAEAGAASLQYIDKAVSLVQSGCADALCTAPISKEAIKLVGSNFPGHTEMLADLCDGTPVRMMLVGGGLRVILQTIHVALKNVPGMLSVESIVESLSMINTFAAKYAEITPRIGVCGLNPHAGEAGHFGSEEIDIISPAISAARELQINAIGPMPGDTIFHRTLEGDFDYVLAMYHDQALIPVKTLDFHGGVNVTMGLPIIRTSPDHGTGFNIAGKGLANESSMVAALKFAADLVRKEKSPSL